MRIILTTGTPAELAQPSSGSPGMGLVVLPDIFGLRPLFDDLCQRLADEWAMAVCAVDPFPGRDDLPAEPDREVGGGHPTRRPSLASPTSRLRPMPPAANEWA